MANTNALSTHSPIKWINNDCFWCSYLLSNCTFQQILGQIKFDLCAIAILAGRVDGHRFCAVWMGYRVRAHHHQFAVHHETFLLVLTVLGFVTETHKIRDQSVANYWIIRPHNELIYIYMPLNAWNNRKFAFSLLHKFYRPTVACETGWFEKKYAFRAKICGAFIQIKMNRCEADRDGQR